MPGQNGLKLFGPLFKYLRLFFKYRVFYVVVGGWLPEYVDLHKQIENVLKKYSCIFVEPMTMKSELEKMREQIQNIE